jgi:bacillithiol system protein YtxJ
MLEVLHELVSVDDLNEALAESRVRPVLLFKHSNACPISYRALSQFKAYLEEQPDERVSYHLITVQRARPVSNEAASRLGLEHETPQAILIRDGRPLWNASHFGITASSLAEAIRQAV